MNRKYCDYCGGKAGGDAHEIATGDRKGEIICWDCQHEPPEYFIEVIN